MAGHFQSTILFIYVITICFVFGQQVELIKKYQNDSLTMCTSGLLQEVDKFAFDCIVTLNTKNATPPIVNLILQEQSPGAKYNPFLTFSLNSECVPNKTKGYIEYNCTKTKDTQFHLRILVKALKINSGANIKGLITVQQGYSNVIMHPQVYEQTNAEGKLQINGQEMSNDSCNLTPINDTKTTHVSFACKSAAQPCKIKIQEGGSVVEEGNELADYIIEWGKKGRTEFNLTIKYAACRLDGLFKTFNCLLKTPYTKTSDHHSETISNTLIIVLVVVPVAGGGLVGVLVILRKRYFKKIKKPTSTESTNMVKDTPKVEVNRDESEHLMTEKSVYASSSN